MSDLISREALYQEIARLEELARNRVLDTPSSSPCYARYSAQLIERNSLKHMIADAPTAYDVDKVIEQLECEQDRLENEISVEVSHDMFHRLEARLSQTSLALRIVKGGGVDE